MKKRNKILFFISAFLLLVIGNPSEAQFQKQLHIDFANVHPGVTLTLDQLNAMGSSSYQSWLIASHFSYQFGNIEVAYLGVGFFKIYLGSQSDPVENQTEHQNIII